MSRQPNTNPNALRCQIDRLFDALDQVKPDSEEYDTIRAQIDKLYPLREVDSKVDSVRRINPEIWATIGANLLGIAMIIGHERTHVITSKAFDIVRKLR